MLDRTGPRQAEKGKFYNLNIGEALIMIDQTGPERTKKGKFNNFSKYWRGATNVSLDQTRDD